MEYFVFYCMNLNKENIWVKLASIIKCDEIKRNIQMVLLITINV